MTNTKAKKIRVMASGVFDLLHPGHIYYLEESKKLGDELVVIVANDTVVSRTKNKPVFDAESRRHMVSSLAVVDKAIVPHETEPNRYYRTVLDVKPDIITLGYDQTFTEQKLTAELGKYGWSGKIVRIDKYPTQEVSSTKVKEKIKREAA